MVGVLLHGVVHLNKAVLILNPLRCSGAVKRISLHPISCQGVIGILGGVKNFNRVIKGLFSLFKTPAVWFSRVNTAVIKIIPYIAKNDGVYPSSSLLFDDVISLAINCWTKNVHPAWDESICRFGEERVTTKIL